MFTNLIHLLLLFFKTCITYIRILHLFNYAKLFRTCNDIYLGAVYDCIQLLFENKLLDENNFIVLLIIFRFLLPDS